MEVLVLRDWLWGWANVQSVNTGAIIGVRWVRWLLQCTVHTLRSLLVFLPLVTAPGLGR